MLEPLVDYNDRNNGPLSNEKLQQVVSEFTVETEQEERDAKRSAKNVPMDTLCHQSPITTITQEEIVNVTNERLISLDILEETIKVFNGLTIQSTINGSVDYNSEEYDT